MYKDITKEVFEKGWKSITSDTIPEDARLCFVDKIRGCWTHDENDEYGDSIECDPILRLYFTPRHMNEQWGDDWDDAPYEHNAEIPYDFYFNEDDKIQYYTIYQIEITLDREHEPILPCDNYRNSPYSVADINSGKHAWIYFEGSYKRCDGLSVQAGETFKEVMEKISKYIK